MSLTRWLTVWWAHLSLKWGEHSMYAQTQTHWNDCTRKCDSIFYRALYVVEICEMCLVQFDSRIFYSRHFNMVCWNPWRKHGSFYIWPVPENIWSVPSVETEGKMRNWKMKIWFWNNIKKWKKNWLLTKLVTFSFMLFSCLSKYVLLRKDLSSSDYYLFLTTFKVFLCNRVRE